MPSPPEASNHKPSRQLVAILLAGIRLGPVYYFAARPARLPVGAPASPSTVHLDGRDLEFLTRRAPAWPRDSPQALLCAGLPYPVLVGFKENRQDLSEVWSRLHQGWSRICASNALWQPHPFWTTRLSLSAFRAGSALMAVAPVHHLPKCARSIRPDPVQNPSGVCRGCETVSPSTLTRPRRNKPLTANLRGFRLMPVSHSVKGWSK